RGRLGALRALLEVPLRQPPAVLAPAAPPREGEQHGAQDPQRETEQADRRQHVAVPELGAPLLEQRVQRLAECVHSGAVEVTTVANRAQEAAKRPAIAVIARILPASA